MQRDKGKKKLHKGNMKKRRGKAEGKTQIKSANKFQDSKKDVPEHWRGGYNYCTCTQNMHLAVTTQLSYIRQMLSSMDIFSVYHSPSIPATAHHARAFAELKSAQKHQELQIQHQSCPLRHFWALRWPVTGVFILPALLQELWKFILPSLQLHPLWNF